MGPPTFAPIEVLPTRVKRVKSGQSFDGKRELSGRFNVKYDPYAAKL